jgi:hypothetical protein
VFLRMGKAAEGKLPHPLRESELGCPPPFAEMELYGGASQDFFSRFLFLFLLNSPTAWSEPITGNVVVSSMEGLALFTCG